MSPHSKIPKNFLGTKNVHLLMVSVIRSRKVVHAVEIFSTIRILASVVSARSYTIRRKSKHGDNSEVNWVGRATFDQMITEKNSRMMNLWLCTNGSMSLRNFCTRRGPIFHRNRDFWIITRRALFPSISNTRFVIHRASAITAALFFSRKNMKFCNFQIFI